MKVTTKHISSIAIEGSNVDTKNIDTAVDGLAIKKYEYGWYRQ